MDEKGSGSHKHHDSCSEHGHGHEHTHLSKHSHGHGHHHHHSATGNIKIAFWLNFSFSIIELIGGLMVGSLAIVADAIHDFGDSVSLGLAWVLENYAGRAKDRRFNFGYRRFSLLSALTSSLVIISGSAIIIYEAIRRFNDTNAPQGWAMAGLAILGLTVNGFAAWRLSQGGTQNEKVLTWHLLEDVFGWAIVLIGAIVIALTGVTWLDPLLAIALAAFVLFNVARHLKSTAYLFLQGRPENFDEDNFLREALSVPGVEKIDHLAVWSLDGQSNVLSARLHLHQVRDPDEIEKVKSAVRKIAHMNGAQATLETCMAAHIPHEDES